MARKIDECWNFYIKKKKKKKKNINQYYQYYRVGASDLDFWLNGSLGLLFTSICTAEDRQ